MKELKSGQIIVFQVGDESLEYTVMDNYLCYQDRGMEDDHGGVRRNRYVFKKLGMSIEETLEFLKEHYGYETSVAYDWPVFKVEDYAAATRAVEALQIKCNEFNYQLTKKKDEEAEA